MTSMHAHHDIGVLHTVLCNMTIGCNDVTLTWVRCSEGSKTEASQHSMGI